MLQYDINRHSIALYQLLLMKGSTCDANEAAIRDALGKVEVVQKFMRMRAATTNIDNHGIIK